MRINSPVTQNEYVLDKNIVLMSTTDIHSHIAYTNSAFIEASGYTQEELSGQPHNIMRHPDMPEEAFRDMWNTLKQGECWAGTVKNRRKDGDHYWVRANMSPLYKGNQLFGYMSVRYTPLPEEVTQAEQLYIHLKENRGRGTKLHKGVVVRTGLFSFLSLFKKISVQARMRIALAGALLMSLAGSMTDTSPWVLPGVMIIAFLLADWFLRQQISKPVGMVLKHLQDMASGKEPGSPRLDRVDEIGMMLRNVNQVGIRLYSLVNDTDVQIREMSVAGSQLAAGTEELNARTTETLANLQHTAQATEELMAAVRQSADTAAETVKLAASADDSAGKGEAAMNETKVMMKSISQASEKIVNIISVIDNIAFQTNILALNAAVEAARAGSHGRGFAVVASEVRKLAQHSASAAAEIKGLIGATVDTVASGEKTVEIASGHIESIRAEVSRVSSMINELYHTTEEQTAALTLINRSVEKVELMAQDNSTMVAQSASSTRDLMTRSTRLQDAVSTYGLK